MPEYAAPPPYALRPATVEDFSFLYDLHVGCLKGYVAQIWGWDDAAQAAMFRERFAPEASRIVIADGRALGVLATERRPEGWLIGNIAIAPPQQGRGLGAAIIGDLLTQAAREGVPTRLQVLRVNPARRLYERLGFRVEGETPTHYLLCAEPRGEAREEG